MTPDEWRLELAHKLDTTRPAMVKANNYYNGTQPLAFIDPEMRRQLGRRLVEVTVNWPRLIIDSLEERLDVEGFRLARDLPTDAELWRIWQVNNMDESSQQAHVDALVYGASYVMVGVSPDPATPRLTVESPMQVTVERDAATGQILAALKRYRDHDGYTVGVVMTPDQVVTYKSTTATEDYGSEIPALSWQPIDAQANPLGVVPIVALVNRPRPGVLNGVSELADIMPLADGVNKLASDLLTTAEYTAAPRRWITGVAPSMANATGEQLREIAQTIREEFEKSRASKLWMAPSADTKFGQFDGADLTGFINGMDAFIKQLAAIAALPPHYVGLSAENNPASAEAIRSAEASLVTRARRRQRIWGGAWEDVMRLAVHVRDGVTPTNLSELETVWANPETRTIAQAADAATKLYTAGVIDRRAALEDIGYTPAQIDRMTSAPGGIA